MLLEFLLKNWYWCLSLIISGTWLLVLMLREGSSRFSVSPQEAILLFNREHALFIDLRSGSLIDTILKAKRVDHNNRDSQKQEIEKAKNRPVIFFCDYGHRALASAAYFRRTHDYVFALGGGIRKWKEEGLPVMAVESDQTHRSV